MAGDADDTIERFWALQDAGDHLVYGTGVGAYRIADGELTYSQDDMHG